nr:plasmid replication protein RepC [Shimia ponticola]
MSQSADANDHSGLPDKWTILDHLTEAAPALGISHRSLGVLRALISFHPARQLAPIMGSAVVFPSNRTLASRLGGMPESTLRRHISHLVKAGLITRRDSANRKRYCRRSSVQELAFGFDLGPLALRAGAIAKLAQEARETQQRIAQMRAAVLALRQELLAHMDVASELMIDLTRSLRRKLGLNVWTTLYERAKAQLAQNCQLTKTEQPTEELSGNDSQNERHIEPNHRYKKNKDWISDVTKTAQDMVGYPIHSEAEALNTAITLAPMIGLSPQHLQRARSRLGDAVASLAVFTLVACFETVQRTRSAWDQLSRQADPLKLLERLANRENCQLTNEIPV